MNEEWDMLSVTDMVYNHTANDSDWLLQHPESAYNLQNSPHLKPAYLLDRLVHYTSCKVAASALSESAGIPAIISDESHIKVGASTKCTISSVEAIPAAMMHCDSTTRPSEPT